MQAPLGSSLWPIPPPRRCCFGPARSTRARRRRRHFKTRCKLLQVLVCCLNWNTLGHPLVPPAGARVGDPISPQQHAVLDQLEQFAHRLLVTPSFQPESLGRCGPKFAAFAKVAKELPGTRVLGVDQLLQLVQSLKGGLDPYTDAHFEAPGSGLAQDAAAMNRIGAGAAPDPVGGAGIDLPSLKSLGTLRIQASRINWKHPPKFDPLPFLDDPLIAAAYLDPEIMRKPGSFEETSRPALVHADRAELIALATTWDKFGALCIFGAQETASLPADEAVGLFCVGKDLSCDRLIINPTIINGRMFTSSIASKSLSPGWLLGSLHLPPGYGFRFHAADLSDFYHSFKVCRSRALRNRINMNFRADELVGLRAYSPCLREPLQIGLNTLAMGDSLAVEIAQMSHRGLLRKLCGSMLPNESLEYRKPVPKTDHVEALAIDDHISLQRLPLSELSSAPHARDAQVFASASQAYSSVGLHQNRKEDKIKQTRGVLLGAEFDGVVGSVSAPRDRVLCLGVISSFIARKGFVSTELLDAVVGCWVHVLLFRRPLFSIIDSLFKQPRPECRTRVFRLCAASRNELLLLSALACTAVSDLRAVYHEELFCLDASPWGGAVVSSRIGASASSELWQHAEQRGYYTKLVSPAACVLRELGVPHSSEDLYGPEPLVPERSKPPHRRPLNLCRPLHEGVLYDVIEIGFQTEPWGRSDFSCGLVRFPGFNNGPVPDGPRPVPFDLRCAATVRELAGLAARRVVREWHGGVSSSSFGTLRRPQTRTRASPCGLGPCGLGPTDPFTEEQTRIARNCAFILTIAVLGGQLISVAQPVGSCLFHLHCFKGLARIGCVLSRVCHCSFGSPFLKRTDWLHNKPWIAELQGECSCAWGGQHFSARARLFTEASATDFCSRCVPDCLSVYGSLPAAGQRTDAFSSRYPLGLVRRLVSGSLGAKFGHCGTIDQRHREATARTLDVPGPAGFELEPEDSEPFADRAWHEDPEWISEICQALHFKLKFKYHFAKPGHINVNEARVFKSWIKSVAKELRSVRAERLPCWIHA